MTNPKLAARCAKYRIPVDAYHMMMETQDHKCSICEKPLGEDEDVIDYCHATGVVRGLLCSPCNLLLGRVEAVGVDRFTRYLAEHANVAPDLDEVMRKAAVSKPVTDRLLERFPDETERKAYYKAIREKAKAKIDPEVRRKKERERKALYYAQNREVRAAYQKEWARRKRELSCD